MDLRIFAQELDIEFAMEEFGWIYTFGTHT